MVTSLKKWYDMSNSNLWECDEPIIDLGIDVPRWIDQNITPYDVAAILQNGCASGAYMPAVTYWQALETMNEFHCEIYDYIVSIMGEMPEPHEWSWDGMACFYVSVAVELWASSVEDDLESKLDDLAGDNE